MNAADKTLSALTAAFLVLLPLQFLLAGVGLFGGDYGIHEAFGAGLLHLITILMTIAALAGKRWKLAGEVFVVVVVIFLQIWMVALGRDAGAPLVSALHPFLAFCYWPYIYFLIWKPLREAATPAAGDGAITA